jgi:hypothetical protein
MRAQGPARLLLVVLAAATLPACVTEVGAGRARTTAPLRLETRVHGESHLVREQVGTVQYTNSAGQNAGSAAVYADRTVNTSRLLWRPYQGDQPIADEDFFRFVGDEPAAAASRAYRRRGKILVRLGIGATIAGAGAVIAGVATDIPTLWIAGAVGAGVGPSMAYFGYAYLHPEAHAMPYGRAADGLERRAAIPLPITLSGRW